jgi:hypothetical protein
MLPDGQILLDDLAYEVGRRRAVGSVHARWTDQGMWPVL